jgi:hypothetical protein
MARPIEHRLTEQDALLGAWCVRCGRPFRVGQVVLIEPGEPARHEDCDHAGVGD